VQDGQQLIGRERTIQNMNTKPGHLGGSQVYGDKCLNDSLGLDTSACSFCRTLEADCHYISVEGKDGTGIGCDLNRPRRQDGQAYCFQAYADGPGSLAYLRANDVAINDPKLRLLKMRTNGLAIDIEQTGTRTPGLPSITLQGPNGQGFEWILTNDGNIARRAGAGDFWAGDAISVVTGDVVMVNAAGQPMLRIRQSDGCIVLRSGTVMC
jgi:hypothetical protein